jgi:hypothetical protein
MRHMSALSFIHPGAIDLQRFADAELAEPRRAVVAAHLARCARCRERVVFARNVAKEAISLPAPAAPHDLIERVLAERGAGQRAILPIEDDAPRRQWVRVAAGLTIAASVVIAAALAARVRPISHAPGIADDSVPTLASVMTSIGVFPSLAYGQEAPNAIPVYPIAAVDGSKLEPLGLTYEFSVVADSDVVGTPERGSTTIARATFGGRPAWRVTDQWFGHPTDIAETTYVDRGSLHPFARTAHNVGTSHFVVEQRFVGDSLLGTMRTTTRSRSLARKLPPTGVVGPWLVGEGMPVALLQAVTLHPHWRGSAVVVGWGGVRSDLTYPIEFIVDGEEHVTVPAGSFDCWRLTLLQGAHRQFIWIRKSDQLTVMSRDTSSTPGHEVVLVSARRLP